MQIFEHKFYVDKAKSRRQACRLSRLFNAGCVKFCRKDALLGLVSTRPKKNIVALHQNGKTQTELSKEYGISVSAISRWIKLYSEVKVDDNTIMTAKQIKELQKRNAQLDEENIILKKALAIMTPRSGKE